MSNTRLAYAVKRAKEIVSENPQKLLLLLRPVTLWTKFRSLMTDGKTLTKAEHKARLEAKKRDFASDKWRHSGAVSVRAYDNYETYLEHQKSKLEELGGKAFVDSQKAVARFRTRFSQVVNLPENATVLCLGARRGEEVQALRDMGHFAVGIDLNPGTGNEYVLTGDFHDLRFGDNTVDGVYTNCLDHAFDVDRIVKEVRRVLKPGGVFIVDIVYGFEQGFLVGDHDCMHWPTAQSFADLLTEKGGFVQSAFRDLAAVGSSDWTQAELVKPRA